MLAEILNTVAKAPQGVSLAELTQRLGQDAAVIEGALGLLLRKGRLVECSESACCDSCPTRASCTTILPAERKFIVAGTVGDDTSDRE